ncbi:hypothetical protein DPEC_G00315160 [Dallia pectoralis]|uniref:Uncharacterized protein n=1 Tax=Dallia pectoralis TaxID=75939 RepID=A0ACC2FCK6_DALPE|nr:hypothetical protein DPEC_G00315160 [Dallia pectoralis]
MRDWILFNLQRTCWTQSNPRMLYTSMGTWEFELPVFPRGVARRPPTQYLLATMTHQPGKLIMMEAERDRLTVSSGSC